MSWLGVVLLLCNTGCSCILHREEGKRHTHEREREIPRCSSLLIAAAAFSCAEFLSTTRRLLLSKIYKSQKFLFEFCVLRAGSVCWVDYGATTNSNSRCVCRSSSSSLFWLPLRTMRIHHDQITSSFSSSFYRPRPCSLPTSRPETSRRPANRRCRRRRRRPRRPHLRCAAQ